MAATALTTNAVPHTGLDLDSVMQTPTQAAGHTAPTASDMALMVKNGSGAPINVDVHIVTQVDGVAVATPSAGLAPARRVAVAAGHTEVIPVPDSVYADPSIGGLCTFDLSAYASVTMAAVRIA